MTTPERRKFLKLASVGTIALGMHAPVAPADESQKIVVGIIGTGGMGSNHTRELARRRDVEIAYVCDVDQQRLASAAGIVQSQNNNSVQSVQDLRRVLDDKRVTAVFVATPDHWHAPAAILALDAGKHVYVEKPCCHNIGEGRLMAAAVQRSNKILQVGTQSRSAPFLQDAMQRIHEGAIGEVLVAKAWNSQRRGSIGKSQPTAPPPHLDFDLWVGPAPMVPYRTNLLPGVWRWWYDFGCGDIGNDGVHDIDVALWGLGVQTHPSEVTCLGGKYFFDDDQQFPDTQYAVFEYPTDGAPTGRKKQLIFEQRIWSPYVQEGYEAGAAFYGTQGFMVVGHVKGWRLYGERNKLIAEAEGRPNLSDHYDNFFACVRGELAGTNADVDAGHRAATCVHLANIAARMKRVLHFDPQREQIIDDDDANRLVNRTYREGHWAVPKV